MGHTEAAFSHLYLAAMMEENPGLDEAGSFAVTGENAAKILEKAGYHGEKSVYLLQHYVRLLSTVFLRNLDSEAGEILAAPFLENLDGDFSVLEGHAHPKSQIEWKTASFLSARRKSDERQRRTALELFAAAVRTLGTEKQPVFSAVAAGVLAEQIYQTASGNIPGNLPVC